jgi:DHA2 family multidrug resistance protein-like MFS transporter
MDVTDQQTDIAAPAGTRAGRREWIGLAVLALACLLYAMDLTVLHLALPSLSADLQPSGAQLLWITDIYGFMVAGFLITMGTLGDRIGRRRLLLVGATAFGVVSVLAALSTSPEMLIASRALLGIAGATVAPSTLSLIFSMFQDPRQRTTAIGIWITSFSAGGAIGPVLGGVLLERFWWGSVFLLALPVMTLLLVLGPRVLPEYRDPEAGRLDLASAVMSLVAVLATVFGLKQVAQDGIGVLPALSVLVGLVVGVVFVRRQLGLAEPMIDLRLFRTTRFTASLATNLLGIFIAVGYFLFVAQYLQLVLGLSPLEAGLWSLPSAVGLIVGSNLAPQDPAQGPPCCLPSAATLALPPPPAPGSDSGNSGPCTGPQADRPASCQSQGVPGRPAVGARCDWPAEGGPRRSATGAGQPPCPTAAQRRPGAASRQRPTPNVRARSAYVRP